MIVQLLRGAVIREPLLVVSPWFEKRRDLYQEELMRLSCNGDWDRWVSFFAEGVAASALDSQQKVEGLVALQEQLRRRVQDANKRGSAERLAADLVGRPYVDRPWVAKRLGLSGQGAQNAINTLVSLGISESAPVRLVRNARLYVAPEVVQIISS